MTLARFAFVVCLAGLLISLMLTVVLMAVYMSGVSILAIFMVMHPVLKLGAILLLPIAIVALVLAVIHRGQRRKNSALALALRIVAGVTVTVGLLCGLFGWSNIQSTINEVGPVSFAVTAPHWVEVALLLTLGFLPAVIALLGAAPVRVERRGL